MNNSVCQKNDGSLWWDDMDSRTGRRQDKKSPPMGTVTVQSLNSGLCNLPCLARQPLVLLVFFYPSDRYLQS